MPATVILRPVVETDLPVLYEHQQDPAAAAMAAFQPRDHDAFTAHWRRILANPSGIARTVLVAGEVAGYVTTFAMAGERHVGYWIGRDYWGRGIATEALAQLVRLDPVRPLHARVARHNVGSIRVLEKCGFVTIGEEVGTVRGVTVAELVMRLGESTTTAKDHGTHQS